MAEEPTSAGIPLGPLRGDGEDDPNADHRRTWKKNERRVYMANFLHMTMYTMCLGSVFDIFLYSLSQEQQVLLQDEVLIGSGAKRLAPVRVNTHSDFELTFEMRPLRETAGYESNSTCRQRYTCGTSVMHITDGSGNGDCCKVGNRMPFIFLDNRSTRIEMAMDAIGQNENMDIMDYDRLQRCTMTEEVEPDVWSKIKVKASGIKHSKGEISRSDNNTDDGGLVLFVNGVKQCEVLGTRYHVLPEREQAYLFLGALHDPLGEDIHVPANVYVRNVKYGRPASNLFVGSMNSVQGIIAVLIMFPIGWAGDRMNRYTLTQANMMIGFAAAGLLIFANVTRSVTAIYAGVVLFTFYQQTISALIYAILADNVERPRRTRAGVNYKTFSTLAQALGVLVQLVVVLIDPAEDSWTWRTFNLMLLPGWALLPAIGLAVVSITPVGSKISRLPNVDEIQEPEVDRQGRRRLDQEWLEQPVFCGQRRRFVVAVSVNAFFIITLLANGMTVRYFSLYFTQVKKLSPAGICALNGVCRIWIAIFAQVGKPLSRKVGRSNLVVLLHTASALFTLGIYGGGLFEPSIWAASASYLMRFACLQTRDPLLYSITMDIVPSSQRSRWAALNSLRTLSFAASAVLGGYLADLYGYEFSFNITVVALLAGLVVFLPAWLWFPYSEGGHLGQEDSAPSTMAACDGSPTSAYVGPHRASP